MSALNPSSTAPPGAWHRFSSGAVRLFHAYGNWLVSISWKLFLLLALLLLICASVLAHLPPFNIPIGQEWSSSRNGVSSSPVPPVPPVAPTPPRRSDREPAVRIEKKDSQGRDMTISIDKDGVRITPSRRTPSAAEAAAAGASAAVAGEAAASAGASAAAAGQRLASAGAAGDVGVEIKLPPNADSDDVREAVKEAKAAVIEAIKDSRQAAKEAAAEAAAEAAEEASREVVISSDKTVRRVRATRVGDSFTDIAFLWIVASAILKFTYKGTIQAEVKAAVATETAESEQLKRQVVEARMAAMQAQVEPHFLFNTLASIDHLIETDPPRASTMQKNLIALLRASMPSMRESNPNAQTLGREMAVIRPYLEILKVRMEDRLQASVNEIGRASCRERVYGLV